MYERYAHQTTGLLSEIFIILIRAACKLSWMSYCSKHALQWFSYMHTTPELNKDHIRIFYLSNDCSTIEGIYFLSYSCMQDTMGELWIQKHIAAFSQYDILCILTSIHTCNSKQQVTRKYSIYQMTAQVLEMSNFCNRAECEIQLVS